MNSQKYIGDSKMFEYDKYYKECQQQNRPFIKAKTNPAHGNYFIQLDMMSCNYELSADAQQQIKNLADDEIKHVNSNLKYTFENYSVDKGLAWFDGVSSAHCDSFCNSLHDLSQKDA